MHLVFKDTIMFVKCLEYFLLEYNKYVDGRRNTDTVTERLRMLMPQTPLRELQYSDNVDNSDNDNNVQGSDNAE